MSQVPKFLMGGVRFSNNFFGLGTIKAAVNTGIETVVKAVPVCLFFMMVGRYSFQTRSFRFVGERQPAKAVTLQE